MPKNQSFGFLDLVCVCVGANLSLSLPLSLSHMEALKQHLPFGDTFFSSLSRQQVSATVASSKSLLKAINHVQY
jgi:hypothetical protein